MRGLIEDRFERVAVQGEISNLNRAASGHIYFTLKDPGAVLDAALFRTQARALRFQLQDGLKVVAHGKLTVYEARGRHQLICESVEPTGMGALALAFEQLKSKLSTEGLFDQERKRPLPLLPRRIGVVSSPNGAAIRDFLRMLHLRFPNLPVLIAPARVQGEGAGVEVAAALRSLIRGSARFPGGAGLDVIVLTRGGGSLEDLWAFNEEVVARAIASSPIPIVSAVGHEVDTTISDLVADRRAPTPTAAAELVAPVKADELEALRAVRARLSQAGERRVRECAHRVAALQRQLGDPQRRIDSEHFRLDDLLGRLTRIAHGRLQTERRLVMVSRENLWRAHPREQLGRAERGLRVSGTQLAQRMQQRLNGEVRAFQNLRERLLKAAPQRRVMEESSALQALERALRDQQLGSLARHRHHLDNQRTRLDALSPLRVLGRGYAIAFAGGHVLARQGAVKPGHAITVRLGDQSELDAQVTATRDPKRVVPTPVA